MSATVAPDPTGSGAALPEPSPETRDSGAPTGFTPGLWLVRQDANSRYRVTAGPYLIADLYHPPAGSALANARLMAAAKDLLMIAQRSAQTFRMYEKMHAMKGTDESDRKALSNRAVAEACEAVIAKATGASS